MKFRKTTMEKVYQVTPGLDFEIEDLIKIEAGYPEGFYVKDMLLWN